uniref:DUF155 domain-containing protein n=1 Tax=Compsopogon caeruleus TaxID=31354 RepID=A0A7S1XEF3_9RHOD|mmetsp:Transcript_1722/g.3186  ORF Transcript_1722/g.3186 Transcript_1722/m.3186 type:complete len:401 (+) Transcript_1722:1195-2397(+)
MEEERVPLVRHEHSGAAKLPRSPALIVQDDRSNSEWVEPSVQAQLPPSSGASGPSLKLLSLEQNLSSSKLLPGNRLRGDRLWSSIDRTAHRWTGRVFAACMSNTLGLRELFAFFGSHPDWSPRRFSRDVIHLQRSRNDRDEFRHEIWWDGVEDCETGYGDAFCFSYGVVVTWGISEGAEWSLLKLLEPFENGTLETEMEHEIFAYSYEAQDPVCHGMEKVVRIERDIILIANDLAREDLVRVRLAFSHSMAQSMKLCSFEAAIEGLLQRIRDQPVELANTGRLRVSDRELMKLSGELYMYKAYINLQTDVLEEVPDWFWDNPSLEPIHDLASKYLDIRDRVCILNERLSVMTEMYSLFRDVRHINYGHRLDWIIIWLILIEVFLGLLGLFLLVRSRGSAA